MIQQDISKLREVPIHRILGIENTGRNISMRCPFHAERHPSFVLYPDGSYHCFGCSANGQNSIDFLIALGSSFSEAIEELTKY